VVQAGETIDRIAASYYRDATAWRRIAAANDITDPLDLHPGAELVIPTAEAVSRGS
jgi:nucleoid-associated protein YgaU